MNQDNAHFFGKQLTKLMQERGISDEELANQMGVPLDELIAWKNCDKMPDTRNPDILKNLRVCTKRLERDEEFFRKAWFGGLLDA